MRQLLASFFAFIMIMPAFSQVPVNDDCSGLINLGTAPTCQTTVFTNLQATNSDIGFDNSPTCFQNNLASNDVWFSFTCPINVIEFRLSINGTGSTPIKNPQAAIYRGDCIFNNLAQFACIRADVDENALFLDLTGLTPGLEYFVRVSSYPSGGLTNQGDFTICVDSIPPITTIDAGSSTLSNGTIYDSGGATGDYGPNENHVFTICPSAPTSCIEFTLDYYNIENSDFFSQSIDALTFFDGPDTNSPVLANINGFDFDAISAGGGVCFGVQASSGCLTIQFVSDTSIQFEGFKGKWKASDVPCKPTEVLSIDQTVSQTELINSVSNPSNTVTITSINCSQGSYGVFNYAEDTNDLGIKSGILLTTGGANLAVGPNFAGGIGLAIDDADGDADLDYLSTVSGSGEVSDDACIIELDVFVRSDELSFEYVFGSEEYTEFVDQQYNDIFAFLISGPGIVGDPNINNAKNIAVLPDGNNTFVQINSVNNTDNWEYYRNNEIGQSIEYDGLTSDKLGIKKSLTAKSKVTPCQTYHLKLAIADRGDDIWDSGVFIAEIQSGAPNLAVAFASGLNYFTESCSGTNDQLIVSLTEPSLDTVRFTTVVSGSASLGVDYQLTLPSVITFLPGETSMSFPLIPLTDNQAEPTEEIVIQLTNDFGCGPVTYQTLTIELKDNVEVEVLGGDTLFVCPNTTLQLQASGASEYFWQPLNAVNNPFLPNPLITPSANIWLQVTGTLGACTDVDSAYILIVDPMIDLIPNGTVSICSGASVPLEANNNINSANLIWKPTAGLSDASIFNPIASPTVTTTYIASVSLAGCTVTDSVTILVDTLFAPILTTTDTTICQNYSVVLANEINASSTYLWSPSTGLSSATISNPVATPDVTTAYQVITTSANSICRDTQTVQIIVTPADVSITGADTLFRCLGTTSTLIANSSPAGGTVQWSPSFFVNPTTGATTTANPDESTWIYANYNVNGCSVRDSVYIRVDSIPNNMITADPAQPLYCPGDEILLSSPTYEPSQFPDMMFDWPPISGELTPDSLWNMVIRVTEGTWTYIRYIKNNACTDTATINIIVATPIVLTITGDTEICKGESSQLLVSSSVSNAQYEWQMPTDGLSCTTCPNPLASPNTTTTYVVKIKDQQCPSPTSITINVDDVPSIIWPNPDACTGDTILLNNAPDIGQTYVWSGPGITNPTEKYPKVILTSSASYSVTVTNPNNGCTNIQTYAINVVNATINAGIDQTVCLESRATLNATTTGTQGVITWQPGAGIGNQFETPPNTGQTTYTATLVFGGTANCVLSDQVTVNVIDPMITITGNQSICKGQSTQITAASTQANVTYAWTPATGLSCTNCPNPIATPTETTTYTLTYTSPLCNGTRTYQINVDSPVSIDQSSVTICPGGVGVLNENPAQGHTYFWSGPGITNPNTPTQTVNPAVNATYQVTITDPSIGCTLVQSIPVTLATGSINIGANVTVCRGSSATLTAVTTGGTDVKWEPGSGTGTSYSTPPIFGPTVFTATLTFGAGCTISDEITVSSFPASGLSDIKLLDSTIMKDNACLGTIFPLRVTTTPPNLPVVWTVNGSVLNETTATINYTPSLAPQDTASNFTIEAKIVDANGCEGSVDAFTFRIRRCYDVANAFTPDNGDDINDTFGLTNTDTTVTLAVEKFIIFNRWGASVWESTPSIQRWDGRTGGKPAPMDTYVYHMLIRFPDGTTEKRIGEVTLIR
jgi:gliding motility-associated-like protein